MNNPAPEKSDYVASKPFRGKVEIIGKQGSVICTLDISDFKSKKQALKMADEIAVLLHIYNRKRNKI